MLLWDTPTLSGCGLVGIAFAMPICIHVKTRLHNHYYLTCQLAFLKEFRTQTYIFFSFSIKRTKILYNSNALATVLWHFLFIPILTTCKWTPHYFSRNCPMTGAKTASQSGGHLIDSAGFRLLRGDNLGCNLHISCLPRCGCDSDLAQLRSKLSWVAGFSSKTLKYSQVAAKRQTPHGHGLMALCGDSSPKSSSGLRLFGCHCQLSAMPLSVGSSVRYLIWPSEKLPVAPGRPSA